MPSPAGQAVGRGLDLRAPTPSAKGAGAANSRHQTSIKGVVIGADDLPMALLDTPHCGM